MTRRTRETAPPPLLTAARDMRREPTQAEHILWQALRCQSIGHTHFRRQYVLKPYILDFFCLSLALAIEVDGKGHDEPDQKRYDQERTEFLDQKGVMVLRFNNDQVMNDLGGVLNTIYETIKQRRQP